MKLDALAGLINKWSTHSHHPDLCFLFYDCVCWLEKLQCVALHCTSVFWLAAKLLRLRIKNGPICSPFFILWLTLCVYKQSKSTTDGKQILSGLNALQCFHLILYNLLFVDFFLFQYCKNKFSHSKSCFNISKLDFRVHSGLRIPEQTGE